MGFFQDNWTFAFDPLVGMGMNQLDQRRRSNRQQGLQEGHNQYGDITGWHEGGQDRWARDHYIDPMTGELVGPTNVVPHGYAREMQAQHEKAVAQRQQRMMQGGIDYMRGATNLLQSYRPGGAAALEANVYGQTAGLMFERARMTQPRDFLSDLRRHEQSQIESRNRRASDRAMYTQIGTTVASAVAGYFGGPMAAGAVQGLGSAIAQPSYASQTGAYSNYNQQISQAQAAPPTGPRPQGPMSPTATGQLPPPIDVTGPGVPPSAPGGPAGAPSAPGGTAPATLEPEGPMPGQPAGAAGGIPGGAEDGPAGGAAPSQGAGPGMGAGAMAGSTMFGQDGDFTTRGMAATASLMGDQAPLMSIGERMGMMDYAADLYESDPFHATYGQAVNQLYSSVLNSMQGEVA